MRFNKLSIRGGKLAQACKKLSYLAILVLTLASSATASAAIIVGSGFTTDTAQNLDFLWPSASTGCSTNDVLTDNTAGCADQGGGGWTALATSSELIALVANMGLSGVPGNNIPFSLIEAAIYSTNMGGPTFTTSNGSTGIVGLFEDTPGGLVDRWLLDIANTSGNANNFFLGEVVPRDGSGDNIGVYAIRASASSVPASTNGLMLALGCIGLLYASKRQKSLALTY